MKPILIASAVALAAPAFAQYPTTTQQTPPAPPTTGTMTGEEMAPTTQMPMTPEEQEQAKKAGEAETQTETPTTTTTTTTTQTTTEPAATPPSEPGMVPTTTTTTTQTTPPTEPGMIPTATTETGTTMAHWDFRGDMGTIGSANWGVGEHKGTGASTSTMGMGGPIDVDSQWSTLSPSGTALTPLEFGVWILDAHGQDVDRAVEATKRSRKDNLPAVQVLNVTAGALAEADTNGDWRVSREELTAFAGS